MQKILLTGNGAPAGPAPQTISFPPPPRPMVYGAGAVALSATASSGLPVSFSLVAGSTGGLLSGANNNILSFTGAGTVRILASQGGNGSYAAAASVEQDIATLPAPLIVTAMPATRTYEGSDPTFIASITGLVGSDTLSTILTGNPVFTVTADLGTTPVNTSLSVVPGLGSLTLLSPNYTLSLVNSTLSVVCCEVQTFNPASLLPTNFPLPIGVPLTLTATATSGLPVTYSIVSGPGTINTVPAGGYTLTATGTGTITVQVTQAGNSNVGPIAGVTFTVNSGLTITSPATLPPGIVGTTYTPTTVTASGGLTPYAWSATGLPTPLTINGSTGVISSPSGGPTTAAGSPLPGHRQGHRCQ